jgi:myo-inositol-1(or 4)-monophosphatase
MTGTSTREILSVAIRGVQNAGDLLLRYWNDASALELKNEDDLATIFSKADIESERVIVECIKTKFPTHGINAEQEHINTNTTEYAWFIDPLDGTLNYLRNIPLFGVSIGVTHKGEPICGVLYFPALKLLVRAEKGKGAFANDKLISVSKRTLQTSLYYAGGKFRGVLQVDPVIVDKAGFLKVIDASSYEFAQIAMGNAEVYYLANVPHDVVAGVCIVHEAGGRITDEKGQPWSLTSEYILVTNGVIHDDLVQALNS